MGSAALYHLARRGLRVLGLDRFSIGHDRGSSHGHTRIMRKAYFEHPDYLPLLHRTYQMWSELEASSGRTLFRRVGLLLVGRPDGEIISNVKRAATKHRLSIEPLTHTEMHRRFLGFQGDAEMEALFEPDAGYLEPENCVRTHVEQAIAHGATVLTGKSMESWSTRDGRIEVKTRDSRIACEKLVICGGAWSSRLLGDFPISLQVRRKAVFWYSVPEGCFRADHGCPIFGFDTDEGFFYGFPVIDEQGMKVANHSGGDIVADPDLIDRDFRPDEELTVRRFLARHLPGATPNLRGHAVCMYTMSPDEHFIVDHLRENADVVYATGFSGHGFKFAPVIGAALADLAMHGTTQEPVQFLSAARFAPRRG
ncbi:MAG: N-methyl-L-tryptophan oxidase [Planctomycetes bacterium]|nr:N-methyl-L-tryptophan oxidase [Planctomycetota bacterium]